ncbi:MAG TPA: hypothetical protein VGI97_14720 [Gemmatimonadaceae bacterium]
MASSAQIASGVLSGGEAVGSFVNQQRAAGAILTQSDFDTKLAAIQAQDAISRGSAAARRAEVATTGEVGRARAALAASGVSLSSGSALAVQVQDATFGELDAQTIRNNAMREALGYKTQAGLSALAARAKATSIENQSYETLATGSARTYGMFAKGKIPGIGGKSGGPGMTVAGDGGDPEGGDSGSWSP